MRKVLIICDNFPPNANVGGLRAAMMAKYLPFFGWEPYVITQINSDGYLAGKMHIDGLPDEKNMLAIDANDAFYKKYQMNPIQRILNIPFIERTRPAGFYFEAMKRLPQWLQDKSFDAIWATAPYAAPFAIAQEVSKLQKCPWVADYRDHARQAKRLRTPIRERWINYRLGFSNTRFAKRAAIATTISEYHKSLLLEDGVSNCRVIHNGFDEEIFSPATATPCDKNVFRIVYTGSVFAHYRNPRLLYEAIDQLIAEGSIQENHISIDFYGDTRSLPEFKEFKSYKLSNFNERVPFDDVPGILARASLLLVLTEMGAHGVLTTKFFEYLAANRPIMVLPTEEDSEIAQILNNVKGGYAGASLTELKVFIKNTYDAWKNGSSFNNNRDLVSSFSRKRQAGSLAEILDSFI